MAKVAAVYDRDGKLLAYVGENDGDGWEAALREVLSIYRNRWTQILVQELTPEQDRERIMDTDIGLLLGKSGRAVLARAFLKE